MMTAHTTIRPPKSERQSFEDQCKNARRDLLQEFARLELMLAAFLREEQVPLMFGPKLKAAGKLRPELKSFETLCDTRNLLAHAFIRIADTETGLILVMEVADKVAGRNAAIFTQVGFDAWRKQVSKNLQAAQAAAA